MLKLRSLLEETETPKTFSFPFGSVEPAFASRALFDWLLALLSDVSHVFAQIFRSGMVTLLVCHTRIRFCYSRIPACLARPGTSTVHPHFYRPSPDDQRHCNDIARGDGFLFLWSLQDTQLPPLERDGSCAPDHRTLVSLWPLATEISVPTAGRSFQHLSGHCVARCWELAPCSGHRRLF